MALFLTLIGKIFPLYLNIGLGYLASRFLRVDRGAVAALLFYIVGPLVVFSATINVRIEPAVAFLPLFFYAICSLAAWIGLKVFVPRWHDATGNILAFTAATGNTGYFGIALALLLFPPDIADIFIFTVLSSFFFEATTGFYVTAKGMFTARQSLGKVLRLPVLYAFIVALILNLAGVSLPQPLTEYSSQFKIAYSLLGMMVIGMGLTGLRQAGGVDRRFIAIALFSRHLFWPLLILALILLDRAFYQLLPPELHKVMFVFTIVPLAGNTVTLAVLLKAHPEKAALTVLLSTLLSLLTVPLFIALYTALV